MQLEDAVQVLTEDQIVEFMESVGAREAKRTEKHIWYTTVCHGGDSSKLCFNRDSRTFYCYTECGHMTFTYFVQQVLDVSFSEAARIVIAMAKKNLRFGFRASTADRLKDLKKLKRLREPLVQDDFNFKPANPYVLECYEDNVFYDGWCSEGISVETMQEFGIRWDEVRKAIIIPHYDIDGRLVGVRTREVEATRAKYKPLMLESHCYSHPLGMNLYGLYRHKDAIRSTRQAIIVEGEKSVLKHHTWFGKSSNMVATCGFNVSNVQRSMLVGLGIEELILGFDKDVSMKVTNETTTPEYESYCSRVNHIGRAFAPYCRVTALVDYEDLLDLKDAPVDQGKEVFLKLMAKRQEIALGE